MKTHPLHKSQSNWSRLGYTLVEMLVAIGLVLLIMILLAQVFGLATGSMEKHRATSANDQQARTFVSIFKGDLCARSFRFVYPFQHTKSVNTSGVLTPDDAAMFLQRQGYFSINENNPNSSKDDTISFTVNYSRDNDCLYDDSSGLRGRTTILTDGSIARPDDNNPSDPNHVALRNFLRAHHNQPEFDDGYPDINRLGLSRMAEIMYFVRNGNLYRRVMLLRDAYDDDDVTPAGSGNGQPTDNTGAELITGNYPAQVPPGGFSYSPQGSGSFGRDFEFSAVYSNIVNKPYFMAAAGANLSPQWNALLNDELTGTFQYNFGGTVGPQAIPLSLGIPLLRFGHDINDIVTVTVGSNTNTVPLGRPKEFLTTHTYDLSDPASQPGEEEYLGRFLAQENSHDNFEYPGRIPATLNPHSRSDLTFASNGLVDGFHDQTFRRGDEILLTNVIDMDIKVWDEGVRQFVDLGHDMPSGHYNIRRNRSFVDPDENNANPNFYEPGTDDYLLYGNIYDTWHPWQYLGPPPYRPTSVGLDGVNGTTGDDDGDGNPAASPSSNPADHNAEELGWLGSDDEVPLKAIQITVRYMDPQEKLVRQVTITEFLTD